MELIKSAQVSSPEAAQKLITQQRRELTILHAIIQAVSRAGSLKETLESALDIILDVIASRTGWICLTGENESCVAFVGHKGLCLPDENGTATPCLVQCVCSHIRRTREMVVVSKLNPACPLLLIKGEVEQVIVGHISVPLITKERMVGQLNIAYNDPQQANQLDAELLKTIAPQLAAAIENARLWEEIQNKEMMRRELLKKVVSAQEEERRRISRELHDELGQQLTSLLVQLHILENLGNPQEARAIYETQKETVSHLLSGIHDLAVELRPAALDDLGLAAALEQYFKDCPARLGIKVDFEKIGFNGERLPREIETTLYRVIQESLTNVARHAGVDKASVLLQRSEQAVTAIIEDNGVGFDVDEVSAQSTRLGLYGIEERVSLTGGTLTIESRPGHGTTMYVKIPV